MKPRKHVRQDVALSGKTGEDFLGPDELVGSDVDVEASSATAGPVGRTAFDLIHETGIQRGFARVLVSLDSLEILVVVAYVVLSGWGGAAHPVMSFWVFLSIVFAYHIFGRPLYLWFIKKVERPTGRTGGAPARE